MAKIHTTIEQTNRDKSSSFLTIRVTYDPQTRTVEHIDAVEVSSTPTRQTTDITHIMIEHFEDQLNDMVDTINWPQVYAEGMADNYMRDVA